MLDHPCNCLFTNVQNLIVFNFLLLFFRIIYYAQCKVFDIIFFSHQVLKTQGPAKPRRSMTSSIHSNFNPGEEEQQQQQQQQEETEDHPSSLPEDSCHSGSCCSQNSCCPDLNQQQAPALETSFNGEQFDGTSPQENGGRFEYEADTRYVRA